MAFFPRSYLSPDTSFTPLFRLLDDFDNYSREVQGQEGRNGRRNNNAVRTFNPRFDVRETENAYELHGELPGIERDNVQIEFTEPQTIVIRGRVERSYTAGTPPAGLVGDTKMSGAITEGGEKESHHASVSDEADETAKEKGASTELQHTGEKQGEAQAQPAEKYWVSERSIGEFSRTFSFPTRVDQEAVSASLNNGILNITVPKAKKHESRRINIH